MEQVHQPGIHISKWTADEDLADTFLTSTLTSQGCGLERLLTLSSVKEGGLMDSQKFPGIEFFELVRKDQGARRVTMPVLSTKTSKVARQVLPTPYSSKIIKAGALLADTKTLLAHWDVATSVKENIERIRRENLFGKASRSRVEDVLAIFRQRYLGEGGVTKSLVVLVQRRLSAAALDRILLPCSASRPSLA
jgi:hypothetical protein